MMNFTKLNTYLGWFSFLIAATVYTLTLEPTTSLWDCGEFIASAYKLEVGHPPGAPLFMIIARFFSLFAGDTSQVAMMVNMVSALASAFTILFLFWTISHLGKKIIKADTLSSGQTLAILGSAFVGAMAYTFSDTFWFSAVEGEVYASSSLFTAVVFWAILKWESHASEPFANRWIILIAYLMGLSIGVHLLNLLAIPAIIFVIYFKKYEVTRNGIIWASIISLFSLGAVMYGIIPGIVTVASKFELFFINTIGLPFNFGVLIYTLLLIGSLVLGILYTSDKDAETDENSFFSKYKGTIFTSLGMTLIGIPFMSSSFLLNLLILGGMVTFIFTILHKQKEIMNTLMLMLTVIVIGYSSFTMIVIRSLADPPMDENSPETVFKLLSYLNREQYGDRPLFKGQYYSAPLIDVIPTSEYYTKKGDKYVVTNRKSEAVYAPEVSTIFPRMYSGEKNHINEYKKWGKIEGRKVRVKLRNGNTTIVKPTFSENLRFFFNYQIRFMYWRYFMWNFAGRQNDSQSHGEIINGNWISGIDIIDQAIAGVPTTTNMPEHMKNHHGRNTYFLLPLILGLVGLYFHGSSAPKDFSVVMLLFVLTGLAIVVYLNQTPLQPRERDYAYAGSFYAFAIWIGLGVLALYEYAKKLLPNESLRALGLSVICCALVPGIMAQQNWDDHDRSGRYSARDVAFNYLESCEKNAILFTNGDNDTFPLWYAQEVEGKRIDMKVCNLMLLNTDWYIDQMTRKSYEADPVPISMTKDQYIQGTRDMVFIQEKFKGYMDIKDVMRFVKSDDPKTKLATREGGMNDYVPTRNFKMTVDVDKVIANGTVKAENRHLIDSVIQWSVKGSRLTKSDLAVLDMLANNDWERPIYYVSTGHSGTLGLEDYLQLEGLAYRLVPIKTKNPDRFEEGRIDSEILYDNLMNKFTWGRLNEPDVLVDYYNVRTTNVIRVRNKYRRLADQLRIEGKIDSAKIVLDKCMELFPEDKIPFNYFIVPIIHTYYQLDDKETGNKYVEQYFNTLYSELVYYAEFTPTQQNQIRRTMEMNRQIMEQLVGLCAAYDETLAKDLGDKINQLQVIFQPRT